MSSSSKSYKELTDRISSILGSYSSDSPNIMKAFSQLGSAATGGGALDEKMKELIALSIGVSKRCEGCIGFHTKKLVKLGVTREELVESLDVAVYMGGGPSLMYAAEALAAFEEFSK